MERPPKETLERFHSYHKTDTDFAASARLLQSMWRERKKLPPMTIGSSIPTELAKQNRANFLTDNIGRLVAEEISNARGKGGLISEPRIWDNLLSSQPLCFNLFGELHYDPELATLFFYTLFPEKVETVTKVRFEHSPGRGNKKYTGDNSAFDVFVDYVCGDKTGFIGIEVKYAESLKEESHKKAKDTFEKHKRNIPVGRQMISSSLVPLTE